MRDKIKDKKSTSANRSTPCETCAYYDVIDEYGDYGCIVDIDEDEAYQELSNPRSRCRYYKFYDEYKSVQKQN